MTSVCMLYIGAMETSSYLSLYADKLLKGENQSNSEGQLFGMSLNGIFKIYQKLMSILCPYFQSF